MIGIGVLNVTVQCCATQQKTAERFITPSSSRRLLLGELHAVLDHGPIVRIRNGAGKLPFTSIARLSNGSYRRPWGTAAVGHDRPCNAQTESPGSGH